MMRVEHEAADFVRDASTRLAIEPGSRVTANSIWVDLQRTASKLVRFLGLTGQTEPSRYEPLKANWRGSDVRARLFAGFNERAGCPTSQGGPPSLREGAGAQDRRLLH